MNVVQLLNDDSKRLPIFLIGSLILHFIVIILLGILGIILSMLSFVPPEAKAEEPIKLTLLPPEQQPNSPEQFIDSSQMVPTERAPDTNNISSNDTLASSTERTSNNDNIPTLRGEDMPSRNVINTDSSPQLQPKAPSTPSEEQKQKPEEEQQENPEDVKDPSEEKENENDKKRQKLLHKNMQETPDGLFARPEEEASKPKPKTSNPSPVTPRQPEQEPTPESVFSMHRRTTNQSGGAAIGNRPSVASKRTPLGEYKHQLYAAIGSHWYLLVGQNQSLLEIGIVRVKFTVHADGRISNVRVVNGGNHAKLSAISRQSVNAVNGQLPEFPENLKVQLGTSFEEEITFRIY